MQIKLEVLARDFASTSQFCLLRFPQTTAVQSFRFLVFLFQVIQVGNFPIHHNQLDSLSIFSLTLIFILLRNLKHLVFINNDLISNLLELEYLSSTFLLLTLLRKGVCKNLAKEKGD